MWKTIRLPLLGGFAVLIWTVLVVYVVVEIVDTREPKTTTKQKNVNPTPHYKGCINNIFLSPEEIKKKCQEHTEKGL